MKKILFFAVAVLGLVATACGSKTANEEQQEESTAITVDSVFANADALVGQQITVEGVCTHICKHGGTKAFVQGSEGHILRCMATPEIDGAFAPTCPKHVLVVTGILREDRIDSATVAGYEETYKAQIAANPEAAQADGTHSTGSCETENKAQGVEGATTFADRMELYRQKIAARNAAEGKNYLSDYYLETTAYEIESNDSDEQ